jgi:hypothetical protein
MPAWLALKKYEKGRWRGRAPTAPQEAELAWNGMGASRLHLSDFFE